MRQILLGSRICFPNGSLEGDLIKQNQLFYVLCNIFRLKGERSQWEFVLLVFTRSCRMLTRGNKCCVLNACRAFR